MNEYHAKVAIIGGGPAGCAAAIQLKRADINPILFERNRLGGLALNANLIENYLGIEQGITGLEFGEKMEEQVHSLVIDTVYEEVKKMEIKGDKMLLTTTSSTCLCDYVIVATGTIPSVLGKKGEKEAAKKGLLFYEPIDVPTSKTVKSKMVIIGGGDAAFDYALNFAQRENEIKILHRSDRFSCLPLLYYRVSNIDTIELLYPKEVTEFLVSAENELTILQNDNAKIIVDFAIVAIGRKPNNELTKDLPDEIISKRVFIIGDLVNDRYRQISIAAGDGLHCAMEIMDLIKD